MKKAERINRKAEKLSKKGEFKDAIDLAEKELSFLEDNLGPEHIKDFVRCFGNKINLR